MNLKLFSSLIGVILSVSSLAQVPPESNLTKAFIESENSPGNFQSPTMDKQPTDDTPHASHMSANNTQLQGVPHNGHLKKPAKHVKKTSTSKKAHHHKHKKKKAKKSKSA